MNKKQHNLTNPTVATILPLERVLAVKKLLRKHQGQLDKLSSSEKTELAQVRQILSSWRSLPASQKKLPVLGSQPNPPASFQGLHLAIESAAVGRLAHDFAKAEIAVSPSTRTPLKVWKIKHSASSPQKAIESFLVKYSAWGTLAKNHLRDCKELKVKTHHYEGVVSTCRKMVSGLPVEGEWIRFFLKKESGQLYHLENVMAYWHRSHANQPTVQFKHQEGTLWTLLQSKRQDLDSNKATLGKALRYDPKTQHYEPIWVGFASMKGGIRKWHVLVEDTTDRVDLHPAGQEAGNYEGRIATHVVTPMSTRFGDAQGQFGFKSQVCWLGGTRVEESYQDCSCQGQLFNLMELTNNANDSATHGQLNLPTNSNCQTNCQGGFFLKVRGSNDRIADERELYEPVFNPVPQASSVVGRETSITCGLDPTNTSALCSNCGDCMCYRNATGVDGIDCHADPLTMHTYYHINYFLRVMDLVAPFSLVEGPRIAFHLYHPPYSPDDLPPHHFLGTIHIGVKHLVVPRLGAGSMYHLIYHESTHAFSDQTGTLAGGTSAGPPSSLERIAYNEGLASYVATSLSDFTMGNAPSYLRMEQESSDPEAIVARANRYRLYPDNLNTTEHCPRGGNCTVHSSGTIWENAYLELEKRVGKATALKLALHHGLHTNIGVNVENSSFVRKPDLYNDDCLVWPFLLGDASLSYRNGDSPSPSFYAAMQESNRTLFGGRFTLEIWDAFDRLLSRQRECLRQPDDFSNFREAATFIHPAHSTTVQRSPHFREGQFSVPAQINYEGDEDWFYFYAAQEKDFVLNIDPSTLGLATEVSVHHQDGSVLPIGLFGQSLTQQSVSGLGVNAWLRTPTRGYYYIRLRTTTNSEVKTGTYSLTLSPYVFPDAESNQMNESATVLALQGANSVVEGNINSSVNKDYYRFLVTGQLTDYRIRLQAPQQQSLAVAIYINNNKILDATTNQSGEANMQLALPPGQWIFLEVSSNNNGLGNYSLSVERVQATPELERFSQTFTDPAVAQTVTQDVDARSIVTPIVLEMGTLHNRIANTIVNDLPRYYRFWAEREDHVTIETYGLKQTASTRLFLYEQINRVPPNGMSDDDSNRLFSQGLPALRYVQAQLPVNNLIRATEPIELISREYAKLRTGNGSISRSFGDSLEVGAGRIHFNVPHTGWYVVGVQPETVGDRGDYYIQLVRHGSQHSSTSPFPQIHQCLPPTP